MIPVSCNVTILRWASSYRRF